MTDVPVNDALPDAEADLDEVGKFLVGFQKDTLLVANTRKLGRGLDGVLNRRVQVIDRLRDSQIIAIVRAATGLLSGVNTASPENSVPLSSERRSTTMLHLHGSKQREPTQKKRADASRPST
jgi:hypothetical protein